MDRSFINRLVGATVVVALVVLLLPIVIDGKKEVVKEEFKAIPEQPEFKSVSLAKPFPEATLAESLPEQPMVDEVAVDQEPVQNSESLTESTTADDEQLSLTDSTLPNTTSAQPESAEPEPSVTQISAQTAPEPKADNDRKADGETKIVKDAAKSSQAPAKAAASTDSANHAAVKTPVKPSKVAGTVATAYVVQLGSFSQRENVDKLVRQLRAEGFSTFTRPVKTPAGELMKVYVGPSLRKADLEKSLEKLNKISGLNGKITEFQVEN